MDSRKSRIARRFGAAAADYDEHSPLQRHAAAQLAQRVLALPLPAAPRVLEIGCGTGHLTRRLRPALGGTWVVSDIAPAMAAACRCHIGDAAYLVMDGERPALAPASFDLVVSSLTAQWFSDLPAALSGLAQLLAPGGRLALATLGAGSFAEWRTAHADAGVEPATARYPQAAELAAAFPEMLTTDIEEGWETAVFDDPLDFLRGLRRIGADTPAPGRPPLTAGELRRVLQRFAAGGTAVSYHLLYAMALRSSSTSQPRMTR